MRVLICDQESETLERIGRSFEVDIATSKATCIDLMRANPFDVLVASERLTDGSGLELLSHVATRWPETLRVLVIEPARLKMLRGKLAPFRLDATLPYPLDEDELEAVLERLHRAAEEAEAAEVEEEEPEPPPPPPPPPPVRPVARQAPPVAPKATTYKAPPSQPVTRSSSPGTRSGQPAPPAVPPAGSKRPAAVGSPGSPPGRPNRPGSSAVSKAPGFPPPDKTVRRQLGNYTPLGTADDEQLRIVEREFDQTMTPLAARAIRTREEATRERTLGERFSLLAAQARRTLRRLLKRR